MDTATDLTIVAATDDGQVRFEREVPPAGRRPVHSQMLLELADEAAAALGGWEQVERIAVGTGPGTFTGIRIGIATAAGLGASAGVPVVGVSTLAAMGRSAGRHSGDSNVMPLIDARRGELFGGLHSPDGKALEAPFVCGPEELVVRLEKLKQTGSRPLVAGPGAIRFRDELHRAGFATEPDESPVHRLAGRPFCELGEAAPVTGLKTPEPLYLRKPDAQLWLERDGKSDPGG